MNSKLPNLVPKIALALLLSASHMSAGCRRERVKKLISITLCVELEFKKHLFYPDPEILLVI